MPLKPPLAKQCISYAMVGFAAFGVTCSATVFANENVADTPLSITATRRVELVAMVRQDCGSCHGLTLKGGLGPALLPDALKDKPADYLKTVILHGRPQTAMPPWARFLSESEAEWIVFNLKKGFPGEH